MVNNLLANQINNFDLYQELINRVTNKSIDISINSKGTARIFLYMLCKMNKNFNLEEVYLFYIGCLLHDIGKTKISSKVLNKREKLNQEEIFIMKEHPKFGIEICKEILQYIPEEIYNIILYHHEKIDGSGYYGKKENEIPYYVQLASIADSYDGMRHNRPYRSSFTHDEIMKTLNNDAKYGKYNPEYVELLDDWNLEKETFKAGLNLITNI